MPSDFLLDKPNNWVSTKSWLLVCISFLVLYLGFGQHAFAQDVNQGLPLKGKLIFQGTYSGFKTKKERPKPLVDSLFDKLLKFDKQEGEELVGGITIEIGIDGQSVVGEYRTTGLLNSAKVSGLIEAGNCKLFTRDSSTMEGGCGPDGFMGSLRSPANSRTPINVNFEAKLVKVIDYEANAKQAPVFAVQSAANTQALPGVNEAVANPSASTDVPMNGEVSYQGTYSGELVVSSSRSSNSSPLEGALNATLKFNGQAVEAVLNTTGMMRGARINGLRTGDNCKLFFKNGDILEGKCDTSEFSGIIRSPNESRRRTDVSFTTSASNVTDTAEQAKQSALAAEEQAKQRAIAAEAQRQEAIAARQLPQPDSEPIDFPVSAFRSLRVRLSNMDDSGYVFVRTPDDKWDDLVVEWNAGVPGAGEKDFSNSLKAGRNFLIVGVHNKVFQFGAGKWSYMFEILGDNKPIWRKGGGAIGGGVGTRYWRPFIVFKAKSGALNILDPTLKELDQIVSRMKSFNENIIRERGVETSSMDALMKGTFSSTSAPSGGSSSNVDDDYRFQVEQQRRDEEYRQRQSERDSQSAPPITPIGGPGGFYGCASPPCM